MIREELTGKIIAAALAVHTELGPGLLESAYEACLCHELGLMGLHVRKQVPVGVRYKGVEVQCGFRLDLLVEDEVVVELKAVEKIAPIHEAQTLTYLKLSQKPVGLILNFNSSHLREGGIRRMILSPP